MEKEAYQLNVKDVFSELQTGNNGLTSKEASARLAKFGLNEIKEKKGISPVTIFINQFKSFIVFILIAAVVVSLAVNEVVDAIVIAVILIINAALGFIQEYKAEKSIDALKKLTALKSKVMRDNKLGIIDAKELVQGDIILLESGDKVPADSRIVEAYSMETQEASLTGESTPVAKDIHEIKSSKAISDQINMVFSGTIISNGKGRAIVVNTGMNTEIGKIAGMIQETEKHETPLQKKLDVMGRKLGILTIVISIIVFAAGVIQGGELTEMFITAIALAVAAIPEGLPAVVTISLALGVQRMIRKNALIRKLPSVETLGSTTVIASDKTGTLTMNEMTVKKLFANNKIVNVDGTGYSTKGRFSSDTKYLQFLLMTGVLCNNAEVEDSKVIGDPTEGALLVSAAKAGLDRKKLEEKYPRIDEIPFSAERKMMATIHMFGERKYMLVKGAPEIVLNKCVKININNKVKRISSKDKEAILRTNEAFAGSALRVLGFAYKETAKNKKEEDLIFIGLQGMIDPPRKEVKDSIEKCKHAGIKVVMITGDHALTAKAIANELGIHGRVITGQELDNGINLDNIVNDVSIYARVNPIHKLKIIEALKKKKHIVAMTGDGVNDAPALKDADIGIAMGITGTDVAKEASDMVLTDDHFSSIVNAVEEGRGIYDNIKKFVNYLLSSNLGEVLIIFVASLIGWPLPLIAVQLLWINLVTDGLPALALGLDPASKGIMQRKPRNPSEKIISKKMQLNILAIGILMTLGVLSLFWLNLDNLEKARTMAFTAVVVLEMVRLQMIRSNYGLSLFENKYIVMAIAMSLSLQLLVIYSPLNTIFKVIPINLIDWIYILLVSAMLFMLGKLFNFAVNRITPEFD